MICRKLAGIVSRRSTPSVAKANGTPAFARAAAVASCSFHRSLRCACTRIGSPRSAADFLRYSGLGRDPGLLGEVEPEHDGDVVRLEPVDDLGGLAAADDHRRRAELLGQVERAVDLVAGVRLPPDRPASSSRAAWRALSDGSNGGSAPPFLSAYAWSFRWWSASSIAWRRWATEPISDARIGILGRAGLLAELTAAALAGRRGLLLGGAGRAPGSNGGREVDVQGDRGGDDRLAPREAAQARPGALWPVAIAPAGAERKSVKPSRRRGSARPSFRSSTPATSNSGVSPRRLSSGRRGQRRLGQVDRTSATGRRPLDAGVLADASCKGR